MADGKRTKAAAVIAEGADGDLEPTYVPDPDKPGEGKVVQGVPLASKRSPKKARYNAKSLSDGPIPEGKPVRVSVKVHGRYAEAAFLATMPTQAQLRRMLPQGGELRFESYEDEGGSGTRCYQTLAPMADPAALQTPGNQDQFGWYARTLPPNYWASAPPEPAKPFDLVGLAKVLVPVVTAGVTALGGFLTAQVKAAQTQSRGPSTADMMKEVGAVVQSLRDLGLDGGSGGDEQVEMVKGIVGAIRDALQPQTPPQLGAPTPPAPATADAAAVRAELDKIAATWNTTRDKLCALIRDKLGKPDATEPQCLAAARDFMAKMVVS